MDVEVGGLILRVVKLEQQNRRLKLGGLGIVLCVGILMLMGAAKTRRTVEAEKIVLLDRQGHTRVTISTPAFAGAAAGANLDDPVIWITDDKGTDRAILAADGLFFANGNARPTVSLSSNTKGMSGLKFYRADGKVSWSAP
jgi:hypothetical protein